jgi:pilus assembly protein CpaE
VNLSAIEATHNLLVVCTPERVALRGVAESQRIFRELVHLPGEPMQYVLNHPSPYSGIPEQEIERTLGARLLTSIPNGGDAPTRAALEGHPLVMRSPNSPTARAIGHLAVLLEQQLEEVRALAPAQMSATL